MKRFLFILALLAVYTAAAQKDVLFTVDGRPVDAREFVYQYLKNNSSVSDSLSVEQYLPMFIDYKLKVYQAKELGYDTVQSFKNEYRQYMLQLVEPYFKSKKVEDSLLRSYYKKYLKTVKFYYIYIPVVNGDTASAYNKLMDVRRKALDGEPFDKLVKQYSQSRNKQYDNGLIGYVTVFDMIPVFEPFLFDSGKVGDVSMPIKYKDGYFLLKIVDIKPNRGRLELAHILVAFPKGGSQEDSLAAVKKVEQIKRELAEGSSFEKLAGLYSDDYSSARRGGVIGWIRQGQTTPEFEDAAYSLQKIGEITGPVRTVAGWEFIKLLGKEEPGTFEQTKPFILSRLKNRPAYAQVRKHVIDSLKNAYGYKKLGNLHVFYELSDTALLNISPQDFDTSSLFVLNSQVYTQRDFAKFLSQRLNYIGTKATKPLIDRLYDDFVDQQVQYAYLDYLVENDENVSKLAKEFYDGLLLFAISNDKVWKNYDTTALRKFMQQNKNKYFSKLNVIIFATESKKEQKKLAKILKKYNKVDTTFAFSNATVEYAGVLDSANAGEYQEIFTLFKQGKVKPKQKVLLLSGNKVVFLNDNFRLVQGSIMADYQEYLEEQWLKELHKKYKVVVNKDVLQKVENQIKQNRRQ